MTRRSRAVALATAIQALPDDLPERKLQAAVLALFRPGDRSAFELMDQRPGHECFWQLQGNVGSYNSWHARLHRVSLNSAVELFERMKEGA